MPPATDPSTARDRALELLLEEHPDVREEYERLRPRYELVEALIRARKEAGVTQTELAERMGRPQSLISEIESGRRSPRLDTLAHAARLLGFDLRCELVPRATEGAPTDASTASANGRPRRPGARR